MNALSDVYSGDASGGPVHQQRRRQPSAERHERTTSRRRHDYDVWCGAVHPLFVCFGSYSSLEPVVFLI